jgi:hypothetical protein
MSNRLFQEDLAMHDLDSKLLIFTVSLPQDAHALAQTSAQGITDRSKFDLVYRNALAVYAVDYYLRCLGFATDWPHSDSRNPLLVKLTNVADLIVEGIGKLECIPVAPNLTTCNIPPESERERIGYLPVRLNETETEATILGFSRQQAGSIELTKLADLESSIEYLTNLERPPIVQLGQWLERQIESGWETLDRLLSPEQLRLCRSGLSIKRGQKFDFALQVGVTSLVLVVDLCSTENPLELDILIQVYPVGRFELPTGVKLALTDRSGESIAVTSKLGDNWNQLNFTAELGEEFTVELGLGESVIVRKFTA